MIELMMVCFVLLHPVICVVLMSCSYIALYITIYLFDGASRLNPINYFLFMMVSIQFTWRDNSTSLEVQFSIGTGSGTPGGRDELFELVSEADVKLYETKTRTHDPGKGGHERRRGKE